MIAVSAAWSAPAAASDPIERWRSQIEDASHRFGVPAEWIRRVMRAESGGRPLRNGRPIVSRAGAMGLMQLMPGTWAEMRALHGLGNDPHDPRDNILAGTAYLRAMHERFGYPGLFAAYNAGPARFERHLATGRPLPLETRAYVANLAGPSEFPAMPQRKGPESGARQGVASGLFFRRNKAPAGTAAGELAAPASGRIFAIATGER